MKTKKPPPKFDESNLPQNTASRIIRSHAQNYVGWCSCCGSPAEGNYSIHRDGLGEGPEVWLCNECGSSESPTCEEIWKEIRNSRISTT